jgi:acetyltransferase-like isoleucine patch superfamily enzyme
VVLPGCNIGDGAVIGANSLVNKDISPYAIAAGVPVKIIGERE